MRLRAFLGFALALSLSGCAALHGQRTAGKLAQAHYSDLIDTWRSLRILGLDRQAPGKEVVCRVPRIPAPAVLPTRDAQPGVFHELQGRLSAAIIACQERMTFTPRGVKELQDDLLALLRRDSETAFCVSDADCRAVTVDGRCGSGAPLALASSDLTDGMFFRALCRFIPGLSAQVQASLPAGSRSACGRLVLAEAKAVCVEGLCRASLPAAARRP